MTKSIKNIFVALKMFKYTISQNKYTLTIVHSLLIRTDKFYFEQTSIILSI